MANNDAPFCNVEITKPPANPGDAAKKAGAAGQFGGLGRLSHNSTLQQVIRYMNQFVNVVYPSTNTVQAIKANKDNGKFNFQEVRSARTTKTVRVTNPDDSTQFVDVEQINSLTFKNSNDETWTWKR